MEPGDCNSSVVTVETVVSVVETVVESSSIDSIEDEEGFMSKILSASTVCRCFSLLRYSTRCVQL